MLKVTEEMVQQARNMMSEGDLEPLGYRILVKPVGTVKTLDEYELKEFETLAELGFEKKSEHQQERDDRSASYGIVVSVGLGAFKGAAILGDTTLEEGNIVFFDKYAGIALEIPQGSKNMYRLMNDESLMARVASHG
jgi:co-chaperonin GroES (HSP10)